MTDDRRHGQRAGIDPARIEAAARAIAKANGDDFDQVPASKGEWTRQGGCFAGRFRDINEPMQSDYIAMASLGLSAAFPELVPEIFDGLPHAWLAPWEATQGMTMFVEGYCTALEWQQAYRTMRDAHLRGEAS